MLRRLDPGPQAGVETLLHRRGEKPFAGIVGVEGDPDGAVFRHLHGVEEVGLPSVVKGMEQAKDVPCRWKGCTTGVSF
jgi:hypothetical protein